MAGFIMAGIPYGNQKAIQIDKGLDLARLGAFAT